ncbi:MAG: hypothetical protein IJD59_06010 [Clostridia bacterium]|nr:hypothetical protein [Clostridia bacterium]
MQYSIFIPTNLSELPDDRNDNIDVCVTLENGAAYTVVFATPANLEALMKKDGVSHIDPRFRFIVVERLSEDIVKTVIKDLIADERLLREYGI